MIFLTLFKTLEGKTIVVELKNDLQIKGTLASVDQYLNFKLTGVTAVDPERFPQLVSDRVFAVAAVAADKQYCWHAALPLEWPLARRSSVVIICFGPPLCIAFLLQSAVKELFVRGSVIRYVSIEPADVDTALLQDAARREAMESAKLLTAGSGGRR